MNENRTERGFAHLWRPYTQEQTTPRPLQAASTQGATITLADGRVLIDGIASWWTACHGYNHPHIRARVEAQLAAMPHVMFGGLTHAPALELATRLADLLPGDLNRVFFTDSGSVSVEVAVKMAVQYRLNRGETGRTKLVSFRGGYHGDTLGTMALCDPEEGMHSLFRGVLPEHILADLPLCDESYARLDALLAANAERLTAIIVEPLVQGACGMVFHAAEVLQRLRVLADKHDLLLILDEIFTGFGRTGTMFACEQAGIVPDIITLSKALTGGTMALAVTIARDHVFAAFLSDRPEAALMHGPTFMANPLACAAACASLELFETEPRLEQVAAISRALDAGLSGLRDVPWVRDVRVLGAIGVVEMTAIADMNALKAALVAEGIWVRPFRRIVYLTPSFTITPAELERLVMGVCRVVRENAALFGT